VAKAAARPAPSAGIELRRGKDPQELVRIGTRGVVIGPSGGPLARTLFIEPRQADVAWYLLRTYAPFAARTPAGDLAFQGEGKVRPDAVERRMILEWTRQVAAETAAGHGEPAYGLVLAWHQGGSSLDCQDAVVFRTGEVAATSCDWDGELQGRLEPAALARVYAWLDHLQPFQAGGGQTEESLRPGAFETRLVFAGQGTRPATAAEQAEIQSFASALFAELAPKRGAAAPPPPAPAATKPGPAPAPASAHLLLPPSALNPRPEVVQLQLPEKPPPVPRPEAAPPAAAVAAPATEEPPSPAQPPA
jgi:hypothetical protein